MRRSSAGRWVAALLLGAGAPFGALRAVSTLLARRVVAVRRRPPYRHRVLGVGDAEVLLARDAATELPGTYGLSWPDGHAVVGRVIRADRSTVLRQLVAVQQGVPVPGRCALDHIEVGDPASAFGLPFEALELDGEAGPMPAWLVPGRRTDAWVVLAHGYGGSLASSLSFLPVLAGTGCTSLVVSYRNDPGAPASGDGRYHLGASEWRDLEAGVAYAVAHGAERVCLFGWSLGGAVVLAALARSPLRDRIAAVVLDCPVLDWRTVIGEVARASRVPRALVGSVLRGIERAIGAPLGELDWNARSAELDRPLLCFHGGRDDLVPPSLSEELARRRPDLVELVVEPRAGHVGSFNVDPEAYAARLRAFLDRHLLGHAEA